MKLEDAALWLEEDTDTEALRYLNYGVILPSSPAALTCLERGVS